MKTSISLTLLNFSAVLTGCFGESELAGLPCPCADGWTCCETQGVCVRDPAQCPAGDPDAGTPTTSVTVEPTSARLRLGGTQSFTANVAVTWSVEEPNGGAIDSSGRYRAPLVPGVYHVRATPAEGEAQLVLVTVGPQDLVVAAGQPGGAGHADGFGGDVRFRAPKSLVGDDKFLYVNDTYSLRRIELETGEVSTLVRDLKAGHIAVSGGHLYVSNVAGTLVKRVDNAAGTVADFAGDEKFINPWDDWKDGIGSGAGFFTVSGMVGNADYIYVSDASLLRRIDTQTGAVETLAVSEFWKDHGPVAVNFPGAKTGPWKNLGPIAMRDGQVYAVETYAVGTGTPSIWKIDPAAVSFEQALSSTVPFGPNTTPLPAGGGTFASLAFDEQGTPLVVDGHALVRPVIVNGKVVVYPTVGKVDEYGDADGLGSVARLSTPQGIWSPVGVGPRDLFVADTTNNKVRRVQMTEAGPLGKQAWVASTLAGESDHRGSVDGVGSKARLVSPHRLTVDDSGVTFVAELSSNQSAYVDQIRRIDPSGAVSVLTALPSEFSYVLGMAAAGGALFATATSGKAPYDLLRYDLSGSKWTTLNCGAPGTRHYTGLVYDGENYLYAVDSVLGTVEQIELTVALTACTNGKQAATSTTVLSGLTPATSLAKTSAAIFKAFRELAVDADRGVLFVSDDDTLKRLDLGSGQLETLPAPPNGWGPIEGLAFDPAGVLYVLRAGDWQKPIGVEQGGSHQIVALVVETGQTYEVVGAPDHEGVKLGALPGGVNNPSAIALGPGGELVIADEDEHVVLTAR